jgi:phytanoyl-CoA dioxygenase PhyH
VVDGAAGPVALEMDTMLLRPSDSGIPEVSPGRLDPSDRAGIRAHLEEHGFACVRGCMGQPELDRAEDLLWQHLEGAEAASQRMAQKRPVGWRRGQPETWLDGHGDGLMTSTTHCDSMWYVRSRPGVINAFHAAYGTQGDSELVAAFDRMSVNLPVSSSNPAALRVAAATSQHGKFGVAQRMHVHVGQFYGPSFTGPEYYAIVPLFDMNRNTGATALVPGSHRKVREIEERWKQKWGLAGGGQRSDRERLLAAADLEPFERCGLTPCVTNIKAGDCVLFDTALFHGAYAAEDPTGRSGNGERQLLRAIYILGMALSRLQTPRILAARRKAYELDVFWPPTIAHAEFAEHILAGKLEGQHEPSLEGGIGPRAGAVEGTLGGALALNLSGRQGTRGELFPRIRDFAQAAPEVQRLIDPTWAGIAKV